MEMSLQQSRAIQWLLQRHHWSRGEWGCMEGGSEGGGGGGGGREWGRGGEEGREGMEGGVIDREVSGLSVSGMRDIIQVAGEGTIDTS